MADLTRKSTKAFRFERGPGWDKTMRELKSTPEEMNKAIKDELITIAVFMRNHIIRAMNDTPKLGRKYRKTKNKNMYHIASIPGNAPARDTSALLASIKMDVRGRGKTGLKFEAEVGSNMTGKEGKYPTYLEFGTKNMAPRPWLKPAIEAGKREMRHIQKRVMAEIRR